MNILNLVGVVKQYSRLDVALRGVSLSIESGEFVALAGPSGSGKTTLLNIAAGLDFPSKGEAYLFGLNLRTLSSDDLAYVRRNSIGFIFQSYNLFPVLNASENVEYLLGLNGVPANQRRALAKEALHRVGLQGFERRKPNELSGGQQQRVAVARALVTRPQVIFADEPTANLDSKTSVELLELFKTLNSQLGITFVFSSHDPIVLSNAKRIIEIVDGKIKNDASHARNTVKDRLVVLSQHRKSNKGR